MKLIGSVFFDLHKAFDSIPNIEDKTDWSEWPHTYFPGFLTILLAEEQKVVLNIVKNLSTYQ